MPHITHWVPATERPAWPCVLSWLNMRIPDGWTKSFYRSGVNAIHLSWNKAVTDFLATDSDWLLSTHSDVVFEPDSLTRLLSWGKPLISALIFMRTNPVTPHVWAKYPGEDRHIQRINDTRDWFAKHNEYIKFGPFVMEPCPDDALTEISFTSTSFTLMHRSVLEAMAPLCNGLWFKMDDLFAGGGEDRRFFELALAAGFPAYIDRSVVCGHLVGDIPTSAAEFIMWDSVSTFGGTGEK